jgi:hypothetical protein
MSRRRSLLVIVLIVLISNLGCDLGQSPNPDPQYLKIYYKYFYRNYVDTFNGTLTKDLAADGTITVPFWLTLEEQDSILAELNRTGFYDLPNTIPGTPGIRLEPDPGPQVLRIEFGGRVHQVTWFITSGNEQILRLSQFIRDLVESKPEYKNLPPARGDTSSSNDYALQVA